MKAILLVQVANGYALAPFVGELPADFVQNMRVESEVTSYSYGNSVSRYLKNYFEPPKEEAPAPVSQPVAVLHDESPL